MKHSIPLFGGGFILAIVGLMSHAFAQATPQQVSGPGWEALTTASPAVAVGGPGDYYIAWTGLNNDVYFAEYNGTSWTDYQIVGGPGWTAQTSVAPALAWNQYEDGTGDVLFLAWEGLSGNDIWYSIKVAGGAWQTQQKVSGPGWTAETDAAPALASQNPTYLAWKGAGSAENIWYSYCWFEGTCWPTQQEVGVAGSWTAESSAGPSITVPYLPVSYVYAYWKGKFADNIWDADSTVLPGNDLSWSIQSEISECSPASNVAPSAVTIWGNNEPWSVLFWTPSGNSDLPAGTILYSYSTIPGLLDQPPSQGCGTVSGTLLGKYWFAQTDVAPAAASNSTEGGNPSMLAWKNAGDNTVWFLDPRTLPGLPAFF